MNQSDICNTFLLHDFISSQTGECRHWNCEDASQADGSHGWQDELSLQSHSAGEEKYRNQFGPRNKPNNDNNNKKQKRELKQSDDNPFSDMQRRAFKEDASQKQMDDKMNLVYSHMVQVRENIDNNNNNHSLMTYSTIL